VKKLPAILLVFGVLFLIFNSLNISTSKAQAPEDWAMFRKDSPHSGYNAEETSLKPLPDLKWKFAVVGSPNSPAAVDGVVYIKFSGVLFARNVITGDLLWSKNTPAYDHSSVAVAYGMVFDGSGKYPSCTDCGVVAYDAKTGEEKWRINLPMGAKGPNVSNGVVYFGSDDHYVRAVNAYTGQLLWTSPKLNDGITAVPAVADGKVFAGTWGGLLYALNSADGQVLWQSYTGGVTFSSPSIVNNTVYVGSGTKNVYAFDATSGILKWTYTGGKDSVWGSPAIAYGNLYIQDLAGHIHALDTNNGNLVWEYQTMAQPSSSYSSPAVANEVVYVGSQDKNIYAFDAFTGAVLWKYETGGFVNSSPAIANGMLFIGSGDGNIYAFGNEVEPTPTPTPLPVTKIVFAPGFGASWNAGAFASCSFDPNPDNWSLASYAEFAYQQLLSTLSSSGWNTKPYYYDWRMRIPDSIPVLSNFIDSNTESNEKANVLAHSMGGLLSAGYLATNGAGKINSFMAIGSPLKGAVQPYPAWSGGDIWDDNFISKIATNLYLKHCGGVLSNDRETIRTYIPSIQNFLPIFDYLKYFKTNSYKPWSLMSINNGWFNTSFNFGDVKFGTLSGTGFDTLSGIPIKDRNKRDVDLGNWEDGKPAGKNHVTEGDGTVLLSSSFIDSSFSNVINQNHLGLVNSPEGINKILEFLGSAPTSSTSTFTEPNSALIIIAYPTNFWVTDQNGKVRKDKNGMVSFINPKPGNYKIDLLPQSDNTLLVVAQFLPNGQTLYKEYHLKNRLPKFKTINFDPQNTKEDILN